jgi:hypothetical protein
MLGIKARPCAPACIDESGIDDPARAGLVHSPQDQAEIEPNGACHWDDGGRLAGGLPSPSWPYQPE